LAEGIPDWVPFEYLPRLAREVPIGSDALLVARSDPDDDGAWKAVAVMHAGEDRVPDMIVFPHAVPLGPPRR
jgi:hypothetical protein